MTLDMYKANIRRYRGCLSSMDAELDALYEFSSDKFKEYSLSSKAMGVAKMCMIADSVSLEDQDELVDWLLERVRCKSEIDIKLLDII